ncbi:hypothetical protein ACP70R_031165 [Stipagrostis hirtigluma subsp. patula]
MDPAGGDNEVGGLGGLRVPGGVDQAVAVDGADEARVFVGAESEKATLTPTDGEHLVEGTGSGNDDTRVSHEAQQTDLRDISIEDFKAKIEDRKAEMTYYFLEGPIVEILKTQIEVKKMQLLQLERMHNTIEPSYVLLEEGKKILHNACSEGSNSKLVDESLAEKSGVGVKVDDEKSKLEQEVAKLDAEIHDKIGKLNEMLERDSFSKELSSLEKWKFSQTSLELQDARNELIQYFRMAAGCRSVIGIKQMGELDSQPFRVACRRKHGDDEHEYLILSYWHLELSDPSWHPFKIVEVDEVVDDDDAKLKELRVEHGEEVCGAVKTTLREMNEYNASGRYPVAELWNFKEARKATVKEALKEVVKQALKKRRLN